MPTLEKPECTVKLWFTYNVQSANVQRASYTVDRIPSHNVSKCSENGHIFCCTRLMACGHVVGNSSVLLRSTRALWTEFTNFSADDHKRLRSYGCDFVEIRDCCERLMTYTISNDASRTLHCLSDLQQCLHTVISLLRSSDNARKSTEHLSNVLRLVAHEGLGLDPKFQYTPGDCMFDSMKSLTGCYNSTKELPAIAMNKFSTD